MLGQYYKQQEYYQEDQEDQGQEQVVEEPIEEVDFLETIQVKEEDLLQLDLSLEEWHRARGGGGIRMTPVAQYNTQKTVLGKALQSVDVGFKKGWQ